MWRLALRGRGRRHSTAPPPLSNNLTYRLERTVIKASSDIQPCGPILNLSAPALNLPCPSRSLVSAKTHTSSATKYVQPDERRIVLADTTGRPKVLHYWLYRILRPARYVVHRPSLRRRSADQRRTSPAPGAQPLGAYLLVKLPVRKMLPAIVLCWGASLCGMGGSTNVSLPRRGWSISASGLTCLTLQYHSLLATRFLLGFFEAACLPICASTSSSLPLAKVHWLTSRVAVSLITASWYRRQEQPMRIAAWVIRFSFRLKASTYAFLAASTEQMVSLTHSSARPSS